MNKMYQCVLKSGRATLVTWLSMEKPFKVGNFVTLKDNEKVGRRWEVMLVDDQPINKSEIKQTWKCQDMPRRRGK